MGIVFLALLGAVLAIYVPGDWRNGDVDLYHIYALGFWGGLPHPLLPVEYPPLSVLPFGLSLIGPQAWYPDVFAFWMAVVVGIGFVAFRRWTTPRQAVAFLAYALAAGVATLIFRFDIVPALVTVSSLWLAQRKHFAPAYVLIGIAALMKIFPVLLLPVLAISQWRHLATGRTRFVRVASGVAMGSGVVLVGFGLAGLFDPNHAVSTLTYDLRRPDEIESVPATMMWLASLAGVHAADVASFGSFNLIGQLANPINAALDLVLVAGLVLVYWRQLRGGLSLSQAALAAVLLLLCTSKVLSTQYILWLVPLLASVVGFQVRWLFLCLLTALVFPTLFGLGVTQHSQSIAFSSLLLAAIAVRNTLLIVLAGRFLLSPGVDLAERPDLIAAPAASRPRPVSA